MSDLFAAMGGKFSEFIEVLKLRGVLKRCYDLGMLFLRAYAILFPKSFHLQRSPRTGLSRCREAAAQAVLRLGRVPLIVLIKFHGFSKESVAAGSNRTAVRIPSGIPRARNTNAKLYLAQFPPPYTRPRKIPAIFPSALVRTRKNGFTRNTRASQSHILTMCIMGTRFL